MDKRIEKTRSAIRHAYFSLLMEDKKRVTVAEIARTANIDRKTFYLHYSEPEEIVKDFAEEQIEKLTGWLRPLYRGEDPVTVNCLFELLNRLLEENMDYFRVIALNEKAEYFFDRLKEFFVNILTRDYLQFFPFEKVQFQIYADYFVAGILSTYMRWIREQPEITLDELSEIVGEAAYGGLKELLPQNFLN